MQVTTSRSRLSIGPLLQRIDSSEEARLINTDFDNCTVMIKDLKGLKKKGLYCFKVESENGLKAYCGNNRNSKDNI